MLQNLTFLCELVLTCGMAKLISILIQVGSSTINATGSLLSGATPKPRCFNCGILCNVTHATPKGQMCGTCHQYYQRTGHVRPTTAPARRDGAKAGLKYNQVLLAWAQFFLYFKL